MLVFVLQHIEFAAPIAVLVLWKGPAWALEVLELEKALEERRERRARKDERDDGSDNR